MTTKYTIPFPEQGFNLEQVLAEIEQQAIADAIMRASGNLTQAAQLLGMKRPTLCYRRKKYGFELKPAGRRKDEPKSGSEVQENASDQL